MLKKTLSEYSQLFDKIDFLNDDSIYYKLAKECISEYPNEDLGYDKLGFILHEGLRNGDNIDKTVNSYLKKINKELPQNSKWAITLGHLIENFVWENTFIKKLRNVIKDTYEFAKIWNFFANYYLKDLNYEESAFCLNKVHELKIKISDYYLVDHDFNEKIERIEIENFLSIQNIIIDNLYNKKEIYFLGENGVGKTVLLQAIMLGLLKKTNEITIKYKTEDCKIKVQSYNKYHKEQFDNNSLFNTNIINKFAYGTSRFRIGENIDEFGYATLFDRNVLFKNPESWLKDIQRKENLGISLIKLDSVISLLSDIINIDENNNLKIEYSKQIDSFIFIEKDTITKFEYLADGYRSIIILLCDLLQRLIKNQPYITKIEDFGGIIFIDEIDMLLHPKWEYIIVEKIRTKLPKIQFFFTTHSPMLILGASEDAVFYKLYKQNGKTLISEQYTFNQINNLLANGIITSPLFDLEFSGMRAQMKNQNIDIDTNDTFLYSRINKFILEKSKNMKKNNSYISAELIDKWILEALELNKNGSL